MTTDEPGLTAEDFHARASLAHATARGLSSGGERENPVVVSLLQAATINYLAAIAGYLAEAHFCPHGNRGYCPFCHDKIAAGMHP